MDMIHVLLFFWCSLIIQLDNVNASITVSNKEELENEMKAFYGDDGPLPDFTFYTKAELDRYKEINKNPFNRTEKRREKKVEPKIRSKEEKIYASALRKLEKGKHVEELNYLAQFIEYVISNKTSEKPCPYHRPNCHTTIRMRRKRVGRAGGRRRRRRRSQSDVRDKRSLYSDEFIDDFSDFLQNMDYKQQIDDEGINDIPEDQIEVEEERMNERKDERYMDLNYPTDKHAIPYQQEMQDSGAPFTYTGDDECYAEGSDGTTSGYIRLCSTCVKEIDFGENVSPQYAYSVECVDNEPACLNGDGSCTQKIIYYKFLAMTGYDNDGQQVWDPYQQYINTTCECECLVGSMVDDYFVGESNL